MFPLSRIASTNRIWALVLKKGEKKVNISHLIQVWRDS